MLSTEGLLGQRMLDLMGIGTLGAVAKEVVFGCSMWGLRGWLFFGTVDVRTEGSDVECHESLDHAACPELVCHNGK